MNNSWKNCIQDMLQNLANFSLDWTLSIKYICFNFWDDYGESYLGFLHFKLEFFMSN